MNNTQEFNQNRNGQSAQHRLDTILDLIYTSGFTSVAEVAQQMNVSEMTIRRDFEKLESKGLLRRTHGGAMAENKIQIELNYSARKSRRSPEKEMIGKLATGLVEPGQSIFIDAGTTVLAMLKHLKQIKNVTVVTSSIPVMLELMNYENMKVISVGGQLWRHTMSFVGAMAEEAIRNMRFDCAFLGTGGIDIKRGLTHSTMEEIPIKKAAASSAAKVIVLADHTKFGYNALSLFMPIQSVDIFVTDQVIDGIDLELASFSPKAQILWPRETRTGS